MAGSGRKIAVVLDFSKSSKAALDWAIPSSIPSPTRAKRPSTSSSPSSAPELRQTEVMKHYDLAVDADVIDMLE
ncbi:hypothetical protein Cni_G22616 [Canna indica]|uniref:Uncharacterized protein n=1 Tax=Canna indica TaxID=4628 RepID=A0AAQ3QIF7_9LILI|nr:hypothetical protein Cni_G22616 [Canna indica]